MVVDHRKYSHCRPPTDVRHKAKVPFRPVFKAPSELRPRLLRLHELDEALDEVILRDSDYLELVSEAWAQNFHASTALEGNPLPLDEVRKTTRRVIEGGRPRGHMDPYRQEIIQHVLSWAQDELFRRHWNLELVQHMHRHLLSGSGDPQAGMLRSDIARIQVTSNDGITTFFEGAPGIHVERELSELLRWLTEEAPLLEPLVAGTLFFHEFESIHPFEDGNGRAGRVLFHGYLQANGLENIHKCILEPILTRDPDLYYRLLAWTDQTGSYTELIDFFVDATLEAYEAAVELFRAKNLLTSGVEENKKRLLVEAKRHREWFSLREASGWVEARSDNTIRQYLKDWETEGAIESEGQTAAKRYRFKDPLRRLFEEQRLESGQP